MTPVVSVKTFDSPPFDRGEILRYAGCHGTAGGETEKLMRSCIAEAENVLSYRVCFARLPLTIEGNVCDFGAFHVASENLVENLSGCGGTVIFAATVGFGIDRLISKYTRISPSRALMLQALGAERIEALCDTFCNELKAKGNVLRPRFSPGYGDVPLTVQNDIFSIIDPPRKIGLCLGDSLLMSPTKSVTAFVGIGK